MNWLEQVAEVVGAEVPQAAIAPTAEHHGLRARLEEINERIIKAEAAYGAGTVPEAKADEAYQRLCGLVNEAAELYQRLDEEAPELLAGFVIGVDLEAPDLVNPLLEAYSNAGGWLTLREKHGEATADYLSACVRVWGASGPKGRAEAERKFWATWKQLDRAAA